MAIINDSATADAATTATFTTTAASVSTTYYRFSGIQNVCPQQFTYDRQTPINKTVLKMKVKYIQCKETVSCAEKVSLKEKLFLWKVSKNTSLAAMTHLAEGLCSNALLTLRVENSLICLVGTRIPTVSKTE
jgi:hypothetical protein